MAFKWLKRKKKDAEAATDPEEAFGKGVLGKEALSEEALSDEAGAPPLENVAEAPLQLDEEISGEAGDAAVNDEKSTGDKSPPAPSGGGFFSRLKRGLSKTREILTTDIEDLFQSGEGVTDEKLEELETVRGMGIDFGQGFLFARPASPDEWGPIHFPTR
jgi:fused signal recognition particle receptor